MLELYEEKLPLTLCHTSLLHSDNQQYKRECNHTGSEKCKIHSL